MEKHFGFKPLVLALHYTGGVDAMDPTRNGGAMGKGLTGDGDAAGESSTVEGTVMPWLRVLLGTPPQLWQCCSCLGAGPSLSPPAKLLLLFGPQKPSQMTGLFTKAGRKEKP